MPNEATPDRVEPNDGLGHLEGCTIRRVGDLAVVSCAEGCPHATWVLDDDEGRLT